jgi:hypothetical protein
LFVGHKNKSKRMKSGLSGLPASAPEVNASLPLLPEKKPFGPIDRFTPDGEIGFMSNPENEGEALEFLNTETIIWYSMTSTARQLRNPGLGGSPGSGIAGNQI